MKVNKSAIRREISQKLFRAFLKSGVEYTCAAVVFDLRPEALIYARDLLKKGINLSKGNYPFAFAGLMADMFLSDTVRLVHQHFYPK